MNKNSNFYLMLKMKRKSMKPLQRKASYNQRLPVWLYPFAQERAYAKEIQKILKPFIELTKELFTKSNLSQWAKQENPKDRADAFPGDFLTGMAGLKSLSQSLFIGDSEPQRTMITEAAFGINIFNKRQYSKVIGKVMGFEYINEDAWEKDAIDVWVEDNFTLLQNYTDEYIKKVNQIVSNGVQYGKTSDEIYQELRKVNDNMSGTRARLIARDQTGKLNGLMTKKRQTEVGIDKYEWLTSLDERVRETHKPMHGKICRWDNDSVYSDDGKNWQARPSGSQGLTPGSDIQCRCTAVPWMRDIYGDIDSEL